LKRVPKRPSFDFFFPTSSGEKKKSDDLKPKKEKKITSTSFSRLSRMYANQRVRISDENFTAMNCVIDGSDNVIQGHNNKIHGDDNTINGHNNTVTGNDNQATGYNNHLVGNDNSAHGTNNMFVAAGEKKQSRAPLPLKELIAREPLLSKRVDLLKQTVTSKSAKDLVPNDLLVILKLFTGNADKLFDVWRHVCVACKWFELHPSLKNMSVFLHVFSTGRALVAGFQAVWGASRAVFEQSPPPDSFAFISRTLSHLEDGYGDAAAAAALVNEVLGTVLLRHPCHTLTGTLKHAHMIAPWFKRRHNNDATHTILDRWLATEICRRVSLESLPLDHASVALAVLLRGAIVPEKWAETLERRWLSPANPCWIYPVIVQDVIEALSPAPLIVLVAVGAQLDAFCQPTKVDSPRPKRRRLIVAEEPAAAVPAVQDPSMLLLAGVVDEVWSAENGHAESLACVVCLERLKKIVLLPCRHLCLCGACAKAKAIDCPICRSPVASCLPIF